MLLLVRVVALLVFAHLCAPQAAIVDSSSALGRTQITQDALGNVVITTSTPNASLIVNGVDIMRTLSTLVSTVERLGSQAPSSQPVSATTTASGTSQPSSSATTTATTSPPVSSTTTAGPQGSPQFLYVVGGYASNPNRFLSSVERFNGTTWTAAPSLLGARMNFGIAVHRRSIYVAGGSVAGTLSTSVERFNGTAWSNEPSLNTARQYFALVVLNNVLYAVGGAGLRTVERYDEGLSSWITAQSLTSSYLDINAVAFRGTIFALCWTSSAVSVVETFDGNTWTRSASQPALRRFTALALYGGDLYAVGGTVALSSVQRFNGTAWNNEARLITGRDTLAAAEYNQMLFAIGGSDGDAYSRSVEVFNGTLWVNVPNLVTARFGHGAVVF